MVERLVILPDLQICADVVRTSRARNCWRSPAHRAWS